VNVEIREVGTDWLPQYGEVPIAFRVESVFRVIAPEGGLGGLALREEKLAEPYVKDYDARDFDRPARWADEFDMSEWGILMAFDGRDAVGGAIIATRTAGVEMLEGRDDLAVLWDIRVRPGLRHCGIGSELLHHAADWARGRGCTQMKIETQNVNVAACRFYAKHGCELRTIDCNAYAACPDIAHEAMLLWYLDL